VHNGQGLELYCPPRFACNNIDDASIKDHSDDLARTTAALSKFSTAYTNFIHSSVDLDTSLTKDSSHVSSNSLSISDPLDLLDF
jgi:hypothetical protein